MRARQHLASLATMGVSIVFCLLLGEATLRILKRDAAFQPDPNQFRSLLPGKDQAISIFETEDNLNGRSSQIPERAIPAGTRHTNNLGLRMGEDVEPKVPGEHRVLLLGDSYTEALDVSYDHRFDGVAQDLLTQSDDGAWKDWRIINAGILNGSPSQYLLMLRRLLPLVTPDLVIVVTGANDLGDDVQLENQYGFEVDEDGIPLHPARRTQLWLIQKSFLLRYLYVFLERYTPDLHRKVLAGGAAPSTPPDWMSVSCRQTPEVTALFGVKTGRYLVELQEMAASAGARFGVLVIHYSYSFEDEPYYEPRFPGLRAKLAKAGCAEANALPYVALVDGFLERQSVPYRDTHAAFLAAKRETPSRKLWNYYDYHFSPAGHEIAGAELAALLREMRNQLAETP